MDQPYYITYLKAIGAGVRGKSKPEDLYTRKALAVTLTDAKGVIDVRREQMMKKNHRAVKVGNTFYYLSEKVMTCIDNLVKSPGKQYCYIKDNQVARAVATVLANKHNFHQITHGGKSMSTGEKQKRFMVYSTGKLTKDTSKVQDVNGLKKLKSIMNADDNLRGDVCKILIATGAFFEGLDINALRGVHILSPLHTRDHDDQAIGRALRSCGHSKLPANERTCDIIRYFLFPPASLSKNWVSNQAWPKLYQADQSLRKTFANAGSSPDYSVYVRTQLDSKDVDVFLRQVQQLAVDCAFIGPLYNSGSCVGGSGIDTTSSYRSVDSRLTRTLSSDGSGQSSVAPGKTSRGTRTARTAVTVGGGRVNRWLSDAIQAFMRPESVGSMSRSGGAGSIKVASKSRSRGAGSIKVASKSRSGGAGSIKVASKSRSRGGGSIKVASKSRSRGGGSIKVASKSRSGGAGSVKVASKSRSGSSVGFGSAYRGSPVSASSSGRSGQVVYR
jgi:hypothetical protein